MGRLENVGVLILSRLLDGDVHCALKALRGASNPDFWRSRSVCRGGI